MCFPFCKRGLTRSITRKEMKTEADKLELPFFLVLNGVPERMVAHATANQLAILEELVYRKKFTGSAPDSLSTQIGVAKAFGGDDKK
ncbi:hypothetical protein LASUN_12980 [Lentilactobacillus sunkii]|uniref:Uncharacterized protein n=2 Tax=Lentilactobacillus sunkii TaxID=481719 RepID=A0A1E7XCL1_9LACO|nr:hypothetical protein LASUN_12980 [Lentilactobacillus sunkii]